MCVSMIVDIVTIITFVSGVGLATKTSVSRRAEDRTLYLALKKKIRFSQILLCQVPLESNLLFLPRQNGICLYIILVGYTISKIVIIDKLKENNTFLRKYPVSMQNIFDVTPINARYNGPCITRIPNVIVPNFPIILAIYRVCTSISAAIIIVATLPITPKM